MAFSGPYVLRFCKLANPRQYIKRLFERLPVQAHSRFGVPSKPSRDAPTNSRNLLEHPGTVFQHFPRGQLLSLAALGLGFAGGLVPAFLGLAGVI